MQHISASFAKNGRPRRRRGRPRIHNDCLTRSERDRRRAVVLLKQLQNDHVLHPLCYPPKWSVLEEIARALPGLQLYFARIVVHERMTAKQAIRYVRRCRLIRMKELSSQTLVNFWYRGIKEFVLPGDDCPLSFLMAAVENLKERITRDYSESEISQWLKIRPFLDEFQTP